MDFYTKTYFEGVKSACVRNNLNPSTEQMNDGGLGFDSSSKKWAKIAEIKTHVQAKHQTNPVGVIASKVSFLFRAYTFTSNSFEDITFGVIANSNPTDKILKIISNRDTYNMKLGLYYNVPTETIELWGTCRQYEQIYLQKLNGDTKSLTLIDKTSFTKTTNELSGLVMLNNCGNMASDSEANTK